MKAAQINSYGGVEVIEVANASEPDPKDGQILVEVKAASINPVDWKLRAGMLGPRVQVPFPITLGGDFAGVVKSAGGEFKEGDEVYGYATVLNGGSGSMAEVLSCNLSNMALKPKSLDFNQAAAFPLVGVSALQALEQHINLKSGQKILIHGGAGGIGSVAVQLARGVGAYVAATCSKEDFDFVKGLGADEVIDYHSQDFTQIIKDYDACFDNVGGDTGKKSIQVLKKGGVFVSMLGRAWENEEDLAKEAGVEAISESTNCNKENLNRLTQLIEEGKVKINIDRSYTLDQVREAFKYQEDVHPRGKVVVTIG